MKKLVFGLMIFAIVGIVSGCGKDDESNVSDGSKELNDEVVAGKDENSTLIYIAKIDVTEHDDSLDISNIGCDNDVVGIKINKKLSPQEALEELFSYRANKEKGFYNVFSSSDDLKVDNLLIQNDFAIVTLSEDLHVNGICDAPRVYTQINETLTQFDDIDGVDVFVGDEELSSYLSTRGEDGVSF